MKSYKKIIIATLLLTTVIGVWRGSVRRNQILYDKDVKLFYGIAEQLGYSQDNYLNFHRNYAAGIDEYYDVVRLLYSTSLSLEEFTRRVERLGYRREWTPPYDGEDFLYYNSPLTEMLHMRQRESPNKYVHFGIFSIPIDQQPQVKSWWLTGPGNKLLEIYFVDSNSRGDIWAYGDTLLEGKKIVKLVFHRK